MKITVLVQPVAGDGYLAKGPEHLGLTAKGSTEDEAIDRFRDLVRTSLAPGTKVVQVEIPELDHPWLQAAGSLDPQDPLVQDWLEIMAENRRKDDESPDHP
jgi:hypothetical protein